MKLQTVFRILSDYLLGIIFFYIFAAESLSHLPVIVISAVITPLLAYLSGLYRQSWRYLLPRHLAFIVVSAIVSAFLVSFYISFTGKQNTLNAVIVLNNFFGLLAFYLLHRLFWLFKLNPETHSRKTGDRNIIIYGAGTVAMHLLQDLNDSDLDGKYQISAVLDNNPQKTGGRLGPYKIEPGQRLKQLVKQYDVAEVWFTMPVTPDFMQSVLDEMHNHSVLYKVVPRKVSQLIPDIRSLRIEDLIQRPEIKLAEEPLKSLFKGKRVLITGAAGSIGSELARQIAASGISRLALLDQHEKGIYDLDREFAARDNVICLIADIQNKDRMLHIIETEKPHMIFHAAAYKHVPLMEANFTEALQTNILGSHNLLRCADSYLQKTAPDDDLQIVNISTDKAVDPESIMGFTKRMVELLVHNASTSAKRKKLRTVSVRFGNVLGSSGSVVPLFWQQIQQGGPVTVTHPDMERFFMTIPEAVHLVLHSLLESKGNDILALDMGEPVKIQELAERLILLSGQIPHKELKIEHIGIRPGEKLKEELFWTKDSVKTENPYVFRSQEELKTLDVDRFIENLSAGLSEHRSLQWYKDFLRQYV